MDKVSCEEVYDDNDLSDWKEWVALCELRDEQAANVVTMNGQILIDGLTREEALRFGTTFGPGYESEERSPILPYVPEKPKRNPKYPQDCTSRLRGGLACGKPAYIGAFVHECTNPCCQHYKEPNGNV